MEKALIITGIGDETHRLIQATRHWEDKYGIQPIMHEFGWEGDVSQTDQRLDNLREHYRSVGARAVIGVSAGASAGAILAAENPSHTYVNVCGRLHQEGNNIYDFERYRLRAPIFVETVERAETILGSLTTDKSLIFNARFDGLVPRQATTIYGVKTVTVAAPSHPLGIYYTLRYKGKYISNFIKSAKN